MEFKGHWHQELTYTETSMPSVGRQWFGFLKYPAPCCSPHWTRRSFWLHCFKLIPETPWTLWSFRIQLEALVTAASYPYACLLNRPCSVSLHEQSGGGEISRAEGEWGKLNTAEFPDIAGNNLVLALHKLIFSWKQARFTAVPTPYLSCA